MKPEDLPSLEEARERARRFVARRKVEGDVRLQKYKETAKTLHVEATDEVDGDLTLDNRDRESGAKFDI